MEKILIIGEKREAMEDMLKHLPDKLTKKQGYWEGEKYIVSWAMGHLYMIEIPSRVKEEYALWKPLKSYKEYRMEDLVNAPFVADDDPTRYDAKKQKSSYEFSKAKKRQLSILHSLLKRSDLDEIILAPDADDEGERIGQDIIWYNQTPTVKKLLSSGKVTRFWNTGSFKVKEAIDKAMNARVPITDDKFKNLYNASKTRAKIDYLPGMKLVKLISEKNRQMLSTGRVQAAILHLLRRREDDIKNFKPKDYWTIKGLKNSAAFNHYYIEEDVNDKGKPVKVEKTAYYIKSNMDKVLADCKAANNTGVITKLDENTIKSKRPTLLSSGDFQAYYMEKLGGTLKEANLVLEYLRHEGYTTYPRTDGHYFSNADIGEVKEALNTIQNVYSVENPKLLSLLNTKVSTSLPIFDDKKASSQNHTPLNVTNKVPTSSTYSKWGNAVYENKKLKKVKESYFYILNTLAAYFLPDDEVFTQKIEVEINGNKFKRSGRKIVKAGWRDALSLFYSDTTIQFNLKKGDEITFDKIESEAKKTTKPPRYTVKTLLKTMINVNKALDEELAAIDDPVFQKQRLAEIQEAKKIFKNIEGIGTNATRETIIYKLKKIGAMETKGKSETITFTDVGYFLDDLIPQNFKKLDMTALWEQNLELIRQGKLNSEDFIKEIDSFVMDDIIKEIMLKTETSVPQSFSNNGSKSSIGKCPLCGGDVFENKKAFGCSNWNNKDNPCKFSIWKNSLEKLGKKNITKTEATKLLKGEKIKLKLVSKAGKPYEKMASLKDGKIEIEWN